MNHICIKCWWQDVCKKTIKACHKIQKIDIRLTESPNIKTKKKQTKKNEGWVCKVCGNPDYCPYIDESCSSCGKKESMIWGTKKTGDSIPPRREGAPNTNSSIITSNHSKRVIKNFKKQTKTPPTLQEQHTPQKKTKNHTTKRLTPSFRKTQKKNKKPPVYPWFVFFCCGVGGGVVVVFFCWLFFYHSL